MKNRENFRGRGRSRVPSPTSCFVCFVLGRAVTSEDFINNLIVCSWPPLALKSSLSALVKEAIVAWSAWGQQWPGSAHHFLLALARLSPLLERLKALASGPSPPIPTFCPSLPLTLCLSLSPFPLHSFCPSPNASIAQPQLESILEGFETGPTSEDYAQPGKREGLASEPKLFPLGAGGCLPYPELEVLARLPRCGLLPPQSWATVKWVLTEARKQSWLL